MSRNEIERLAEQMRVSCTDVIGFSELILDGRARTPYDRTMYEVWFHASSVALATNLLQFIVELGKDDEE